MVLTSKSRQRPQPLSCCSVSNLTRSINHQREANEDVIHALSTGFADFKFSTRFKTDRNLAREIFKRFYGRFGGELSCLSSQTYWEREILVIGNPAYQYSWRTKRFNLAGTNWNPFREWWGTKHATREKILFQRVNIGFPSLIISSVMPEQAGVPGSNEPTWLEWARVSKR